MTECATCGIAPCDLPDEVDPDLVFETEDGVTRCGGCASGGTFLIEFTADTPEPNRSGS